MYSSIRKILHNVESETVGLSGAIHLPNTNHRVCSKLKLLSYKKNIIIFFERPLQIRYIENQERMPGKSIGFSKDLSDEPVTASLGSTKQ
jgi:hypothetical protein